MSVVKTEHHNWKTSSGKLAKGCEQCVKGEKLVLFVTGVCGNACSYCPVSDEKNLKDCSYANERCVYDVKGMLEEAEMMRAKGAGITGGDPLAALTRTEEFLRALKKRFGPSFHTHLYAPLLRINEQNLQRLYAAGLDELRLHPKLDDESWWPRILLAKRFRWSVGVEVPVIPGYERQLKRLLSFLAYHQAVDFVNLNEFEYADNEVFERAGVHHEPMNRLSYGVKGSVELGKKLLVHADSLGLPAHLCTARSKDSVQLAKRLQRRSVKAAKPFDALDDEGLLTRGAIYDSCSIADAGYQRMLAAVPPDEKQRAVRRLRSLRRKMINEWDVPDELVMVDEERLRLLTTTSVAEHAAKELNMTIALVKEYPTHDCFIVEAEVLRRRGDHGDQD